MTNLIIKSNVKKKVAELDEKFKDVTSVSEEVITELEKIADEALRKGIQRAKSNNRRMLMARDL